MSAPERAGGDGSRRVALRALVAGGHGARSDRALDRALSTSGLSDPDRRLATEIVYGTLRRQASLDRSLAPFVRRGWDRLDRVTRNALRMGAYQAACLDTIPAHAAVDTSVDAAASLQLAGRGLVNGVLRSWLRSGAALDPGRTLADSCEVPEWLGQRWQDRYGQERARRWLTATLKPPPRAVRVHRRVVSPAEAIAELAHEGIQAEPSAWVSDALRIRSGSIHRARLLALGALTMRGETGQLVTELLPSIPGEMVLDVCAGRGGKSIQLAEQGGYRRVVALDRSRSALMDCQVAARRAGVREVSTIRADVSRPAPLRSRWTRILVDAPCSGLGTIRRHPEIKWRIQEAMLTRRARVQIQILAQASRLLEPGGLLLYATCSTEPEENERVVETVLREHSWLRQVALPAEGRAVALVGADGALRTYPDEPDLDGFYAALLQRRTAASGA